MEKKIEVNETVKWYDLGTIGYVHLFGDEDGNVHYVELIEPNTYPRSGLQVRLVRPKPEFKVIHLDDKPSLVQLEKEIVMLKRFALELGVTNILVGYSKMLKCWIRGEL